MTKKLTAWLPTLIWMGLIFYVSSKPAIPTSDIYWHDFALKKTAHLIEYFILGFLVYRSLRITTNLPKVKIMLLTILGCGLYAASDEFHQSFVPGRGPHIRDVAIDVIGASVAAVVMQKSSFRFDSGNFTA